MAEAMKSADQQQRIVTNRLLRCTRTRRYWDGRDWNSDPSFAAIFKDEMDAVRACVRHDLHQVELVLRSPQSGVEVFSTSIR